MSVTIETLANIPAPSINSVIGVLSVTTASSSAVDFGTSTAALALLGSAETVWTFQADGGDVWVLFADASASLGTLNAATTLAVGTANGGTQPWKIPNNTTMSIPMGPKRRYMKHIGSASCTLRIMKDGG